VSIKVKDAAYYNRLSTICGWVIAAAAAVIIAEVVWFFWDVPTLIVLGCLGFIAFMYAGI